MLNHIELPSTIRPYCLVLNMNSRELHFQSHEEGVNRFFYQFGYSARLGWGLGTSGRGGDFGGLEEGFGVFE